MTTASAIDRLVHHALAEGLDGALLTGGQALAVSTDAFVVRPLFFPGGDIGSLSPSTAP
jgi:hydrogenase maturation factor